MSYSAKSIANQFLKIARENGEGISPMKLQKLVYYAHGWFTGFTGNRLINEQVEAWKFGPVIPSLYHEFKDYGSSSINRAATEFEGLSIVEVPTPSDENVSKFVQTIWNSYGKFTAIALSEMTHALDSPWDKTFKLNPTGLSNADIPFELIKKHFETAVAENARLKVVKANA